MRGLFANAAAKFYQVELGSWRL